MEAKALILAAGAGTRMKSNKPKVAHEMLGKPLVRWVVDAARQAGCEDVHVVIGHGREQVEPLLGDCVISYQLEMLGTGHTVMCAADKLEGFEGNVVVLCGDSPLIRPATIEALIAAHEATGSAATVAYDGARRPLRIRAHRARWKRQRVRHRRGEGLHGRAARHP